MVIKLVKRGKMMLKIHSLFQKFYGFLKKISKRTYRNCAVILAGTAIVSLISLNAKDFGGSGKNKVITVQKEPDAGETDEEDTESTNAINQIVEIPTVNQIDEDIHSLTSVQNNVPENRNQSEASAEEKKKEADMQEVTNIGNENIGKTSIVSGEDYEILCRIVEAEATGEDLQGKTLVANVILNRVKSEDFPDTVKEVVFQKTGDNVQFSPMADGRYERVVITEETQAAVENALEGDDKSQGALYFSSRSKADPTNMSWFDENLDWLFQYGNHEFYTNQT